MVKRLRERSKLVLLDTYFVPDYGSEIPGNSVNLAGLFAFDHDARKRFSSGVTQEQAPMLAHRFFDLAHFRLNLWQTFKRNLFAHFHVNKKLRKAAEPLG